MVSDEMGMNDVGEVPLQAPAGFLRGLGLGELALVVGLLGTGVADLADRDQVQGGVELAVATPVQPMPAHIATGPQSVSGNDPPDLEDRDHQPEPGSIR